MAGLALALAVPTACSRVEGILDSRAEGYAKGFGGAVAADEPQAALVARDILAVGGNAVDAAVAAYFTMSVTLPSAASLGAEGVCIVHDKTRATAEAIDFTHPTAGRFAGRAVPLAPRAMMALHAKYGHLPWTQLMGPAESLARFGYPASRALASALAANPRAVSADPMLAQIFADKSGNPVAEAARVQQFALAATLGALRRQPSQFYIGPSGRRIAEDYTRAGVPLSAEDVRTMVPRLRPVVSVETRNQVAHFPPTPAGLVSAQAWAMLFVRGVAADAGPARQASALAEVSRRAWADAGRWFAVAGGAPDATGDFVSVPRLDRLMAGFDPARRTNLPDVGAGTIVEPADDGAASVIAADVFGQSVACGFSMGGVLGSGRIAPETGIVVAAPPDPARRGASTASLMILRNGTQQQMEFVGAVTGGAVAPIAVVDAAIKMLDPRYTAEGILAAPRLYHPARPDRVMIEERPGADGIAAELRAAGYQVTSVPSHGRANILLCPRGFEGAQSQCNLRTDRRGFGLAQQN
ncbi:MAG: hypothetical protein RL477_1895 [Pseudomonadota bacterium]